MKHNFCPHSDDVSCPLSILQAFATAVYSADHFFFKLPYCRLTLYLTHSATPRFNKQ